MNSLPKFLWSFIKNYKSLIITFFVCATILGTWGPINAIIIKNIINYVATTPSEAIIKQKLFWPSVLLLFNLMLHDLTWRCWDLINYKVQPQLKDNIIQHTYGRILKQSTQFFQDNFAYKITENINTVANAFEKTLSQTAMHLARGIVMLTIALATMYLIHPLFAAGLLLWVALYIGITYKFNNKATSFIDAHAIAEANVSSLIFDTISNSQSVRFFSQHDNEIKYLDKSIQDMREKFRQKTAFKITSNFIQRLSQTVLVAYMLYMLAYLKTLNQINVGDFALILGLTLDVGWTLWWITEQMEHINDALRYGKQSLSTLFLPQDVQDKEHASKLKVHSGKIQFNNVHFIHNNSDFLFANKSLIIPAGQKVGIVGHPGGGKTTFANLIMRLHDVASGSIKIDNQDIRDVVLSSLHEAIGYIPQEPMLFNRTMIENIRYGNPNASEFEVILAAKRAHAHEFIDGLPHKYNTIVGEHGIRLNGGQRQRIAIARAILKNAPILILDEATSQLDSVN